MTLKDMLQSCKSFRDNSFFVFFLNLYTKVFLSRIDILLEVISTPWTNISKLIKKFL